MVTAVANLLSMIKSRTIATDFINPLAKLRETHLPRASDNDAVNDLYLLIEHYRVSKKKMIYSW